eukprot:7509655-Pyramimonas_sp.AAC.1
MQFGVRKRFNLRGTRYSLPAPKGGREAKNPVLREDETFRKGHDGKGIRKKKVDDDDFSCFEGALSQQRPEAGDRFDVVHRKNPNERKGARSSRRK